MSEYSKVTVAALAITPGPGGTITFLHQQRGPYAGHWLLPGGKVDPGESVPAAACREAGEEAGVDLKPDDMTLTGVYEMLGQWSGGSYHLIMFCFLAAGEHTVPAGWQGDQVGEVVQVPADSLTPHPTVMRILNDAGVTVYDQADIEAGLERDGITMLRLAAGLPA
ncbi:NUDIX hydrolase [Longispora sp. NPDC051575]|uniref:NUDIX hydrolase n=1 Tax=Longispora sp. NPDC051575 TaxID=3154943 RepID=UPI003433C94A